MLVPRRKPKRAVAHDSLADPGHPPPLQYRRAAESVQSAADYPHPHECAGDLHQRRRSAHVRLRHHRPDSGAAGRDHLSEDGPPRHRHPGRRLHPTRRRARRAQPEHGRLARQPCHRRGRDELYGGAGAGHHRALVHRPEARHRDGHLGDLGAPRHRHDAVDRAHAGAGVRLARGLVVRRRLCPCRNDPLPGLREGGPGGCSRCDRTGAIRASGRWRDLRPGDAQPQYLAAGCGFRRLQCGSHRPRHLHAHVPGHAARHVAEDGCL